MNEQEIFNTVKGLIKPYVADAGTLDTATLDTKVVEDLHVNSARIVDIILAIEDEFDIEIGDDEIEVINSLGGVVSLVSSKLN